MLLALRGASRRVIILNNAARDTAYQILWFSHRRPLWRGAQFRITAVLLDQLHSPDDDVTLMSGTIERNPIQNIKNMSSSL